MNGNPLGLDRRERFNDETTALLAALRGWQNEMWTACPGIIQSYDAATQSCSVQLALLIPVNGTVAVASGDIADKAAGIVHKQVPLLQDVPVIFPRAGGFALTFPVVKGDECLVVFSSRCIDEWWVNGGYANKLSEYRLHDLSDGFAIPGPTSKPKKLPGVSTNSTQLRSESGVDFVEVKQGHIINITSTGPVNINATNATITTSGFTKILATGAATIQAATAAIQAAAITLGNGGSLKKLVNETFLTLFNNHQHNVSGVQAGVSTVTSGAPTVAASGETTSVTTAE